MWSSRCLFNQVTGAVTNDLDRIIDENYYPLESARTSNLRHRPIGIGVHGLAGVFILLGMSFDSPEVNLSAQLSTLENILFSLLWPKQFNLLLGPSNWIRIYLGPSNWIRIYLKLHTTTLSKLSAKDGAYETYKGSPMSKVCMSSRNSNWYPTT